MNYPIYIVVLILLASNTPILAQEPNDFFARRAALSGSSASVTASSAEATDEVGEINLVSIGTTSERTLWWSWTAEATGMVSLDTQGSAGDTGLAVYVDTIGSGQLSTLTMVARNRDAQPPETWSRVGFQVAEGTTYLVQLATRQNGTMALNLSFTANDMPSSVVGADFYGRRPMLEGDRAMGLARSDFFTDEADEVNLVSIGTTIEKTMWWRWVSPSNGELTLDTRGSTVNTGMAVYTDVLGTDILKSLTFLRYNLDAQPPESWSRVQFQVSKGTEYEIAVATRGSGDVVLNLAFIPNDLPGSVVAADRFDRRAQLTGGRAIGIARSSFYSDESREVNLVSIGNTTEKTMWWELTSEASGPTTIDTLGSDAEVAGLAVYVKPSIFAETSLANLEEVSRSVKQLNDAAAMVSFDAVKGQTYFVTLATRENANIQINIDGPSLPVEPGVTPAFDIRPAVELRFQSALGVVYQWETSNDARNWRVLGEPITGTGEALRVFRCAEDAAGFFRLQSTE